VRGVSVLTSDACGSEDPYPQMSALPWPLVFHQDLARESRGACGSLIRLETTAVRDLIRLYLGEFVGRRDKADIFVLRHQPGKTAIE
jgi:hypothetical protein